jgi:hypothetical protein
MPVQ